MSESTPAAPTSTRDIAATVVQEAESAAADTAIDTASSTPASTPQIAPGSADKEPVAAATADPSTPKPVLSDDLDSIPAEIKTLDGKTRENKIPYSKVQKISANAVTKATEPLNQKITAYEQRLQAISEVEQIMKDDPERFLQMLPSINPAYRQYVQQNQSQQADPSSEAPQIQLVRYPDGSVAPDPDSVQRLLDWQAGQTESRIEKKFSDRFGPIERDYKSQQMINAAIPGVQAQIADARTWPQFTEHEPAIVKALEDNPKWSLERAYQQVVLPKLTGDRNKIRQEVMAEINNQPHSTSAATSTSGAKSTSGPRSTRDIALEIMKGSK